ncbi:hypothetical protein [Crenothrix polyspora]|uniref:Uncharacterized protein n=1 Tax=Crenothrix polyspora TaxID=360316 RepID=A0A1R4HFJ8_9GAMM|nr:hypothetical protein [Crenothrix polyspora]SJM94996.1 hypothetical protein CRENPOLYSF1_610045 [Crenothrix polyspora]
MLIIDFKSTPKRAFIHGFLKGISAPFMLFGQFSAPPKRKIEQITAPNLTAKQALENDWKVIGADFYKVIDTYGKETSIRNKSK